MDKNLTISSAGIVGGASVATNMVIFNDPLYIYLASIGAFLSFVGIIHEMYHTKGRAKLGAILTDLFKSLMLGGVLAPMYFMLLLNNGNAVVGLFVDIDVSNGMQNSFWFLLSMLMSWYSPLIWAWLLKKAGVVFRIKKEEKR